MPINHTPAEQSRKPENKPQKKISFMASEPKYSFEDVILPEDILTEIKNVIALSKYRELLFDEWGLGSVIKRNQNISINLYGDSGTGKTMTAHAIAKSLNKKVLFVKYSEIESKYVGETSKNLLELFNSAQEQENVIIFDEADALLSKRVTSMNSATDVSVNQTRNVLLKLLDEYSGTVIFTTNFIQNFDFAFMRRILCHIKFETPNEAARKRLWSHYLVNKLPLKEERELLISDLSKIENLTGADISIIVLKAALGAVENRQFTIDRELLREEAAKIQKAKMARKGDIYTVSSRKVSPEYVTESLNGKRNNEWA